MKRVPEDIDQLMWTIAESGDMPAADDFEKRFPEFRSELASRLGLVRGLRQAKPNSHDPRPLPKFVPREEPVVVRRPIWPVAVLGGLAAVALATYAVITILPGPSKPLPQDRDRPALHSPVEPTFDREDHATGDSKSPASIEGNEGLMPTVPATTGSTGSSPGANQPLMPWDKRQSIAINDAPLKDVFDLIAQTCHLEIALAPDMPNPTISVKYENRTGMEMLKDLGRLHRFTALYQGNGQVLIVPAVEFRDPE